MITIGRLETTVRSKEYATFGNDSGFFCHSPSNQVQYEEKLLIDEETESMLDFIDPSLSKIVHEAPNILRSPLKSNKKDKLMRDNLQEHFDRQAADALDNSCLFEHLEVRGAAAEVEEESKVPKVITRSQTMKLVPKKKKKPQSKQIEDRKTLKFKMPSAVEEEFVPFRDVDDDKKSSIKKNKRDTVKKMRT